MTPADDAAFAALSRQIARGAGLTLEVYKDKCVRRRIEDQDLAPVTGVRAVVVGHTPLRQAVALGNVYHIDTAGWLPQGRFTLLDLTTLEPAGGDTVLVIPPESGWAD